MVQPGWATPRTAGDLQPFQVMVKPRGPLCNLNCSYCYYLPKSGLYPHSSFRLTDDVLERFTDQYIASQPAPEVTFCWQGGEPTLMGLDFFRQALEMQERFGRQGVRICNSIQTNGTLLDDEWCSFFRDHGFLVGISLDGPEGLHNAYRRDRAGQGSFRRVMEGLSRLMTHGVETNVLACVSAGNVGRPLDVYRFLRDDAGVQFIQFIPIIERDNSTGFQQGHRPAGLSLTGRQYGAFLMAVFDDWVRRDVGQVFVQIFDVALAAWVGQPPGLCVFEETCGLAPVLEHNGDLYACDHFVEPRYRLGNLRESSILEMMNSEQQRLFGQAKRDALPDYCLDCDVRFVCNGGCPKNRIAHTPSGQRGLNVLCEGYRTFFRHVRAPMELMAAELRAGRAPAGVMRQLAREEERVQQQFGRARRNDPCPCGSGRKFKHCHGRQRNAQVSEP